MSASLEVEFGDPSNGWISVRLASPEMTYEDSFSCIYATLDQLCGALCDAASAVPTRNVTFLLEPTELELAISADDGDEVTVLVDAYRDRRRYPGAHSSRVFAFTGPRPVVILAFWRALRRLQTCLPPSDFEQAWRRPFPEREMASLTRLVETAPFGSAG